MSLCYLTVLFGKECGDGGLSPYHLEGGADIVFQIGTPLLRYYGLNRP